MPQPRCFAVVKRRRDGMIMMVYAAFTDEKAAYACAENANAWYGEDHPLTPLTVQSDILFEPKPFPVKVREAGGNIFQSLTEPDEWGRL